MNIFFDNIWWMAWNLVLAILPLIFLWWYGKTRNTAFKVISALCWFLFLPNSIYVITDLIHTFRQFPRTDLLGQLILFMQYTVFIVIGLLCFLWGLYPFEKKLQSFKQFKKKNKELIIYIIVALNMVFGFAMTLGRVERSNSWDVFFAPHDLARDVFHLLTTPEYLFLSIIFGLFANFFYFLFRKPAARWLQTVIK